VLAGEINRNTENIPLAFANYEKTLRPFVEEIQNVNPSLLRLGFPQTQLGISILHFVAGMLCFFRIPELVTRFSSEERGGWKLPDYPELKQCQ
jgi:hypothetical protein